MLVPGALVVALACSRCVALRARPRLGFLGAWFFVTLAPTSSVVPIATEVGAERRMYLPLMALAVLAWSSACTRAARRGAAAMRASRLPAGRHRGRVPAAGRRHRRAHARVPERAVDRAGQRRSLSARARALEPRDELVAANEHSAALAQLEEAIKDYPPAHLGLATEMATSGRMDDAVKYAQEFIRLMPSNAEVPTARDLMGRALALQGKYEPAAEQFNLLAYARPNDPGPLVSMGDARLRQRRLHESIASYQAALRLRPGDPDILGQLGLALSAAGRMGRRVAGVRRRGRGAAHRRPAAQPAGAALAAEGRYVDAVAARCAASWSWPRRTARPLITSGSSSSWRRQRAPGPRHGRCRKRAGARSVFPVNCEPQRSRLAT